MNDGHVFGSKLVATDILMKVSVIYNYLSICFEVFVLIKCLIYKLTFLEIQFAGEFTRTLIHSEGKIQNESLLTFRVPS